MNKRWKEILNNTRKYKVFFGLLTVLLLAGTIGMTSAAQIEKRAANIKSKGNFDFENGTVFFASSDLVYLADEIDVLEDTYKTETVKALNGISTYFNLDGSITHNPEESTLASAGAPSLPYNAITAGILNSQSIPSQTYRGTLPGSKTETTGNISGAAGANLSLGAAAWVDGHLIVGTGGDNSAYYKNGYDAGNKKGYEDGYDAGYEKGHGDGYKEGNTAGYENGYSDGREQGRQDVTSNPGEYGINIIKYGDSIAAESFNDFGVIGINGDNGAVKSKTYNIPITKSNKMLYGIAMTNKLIARGTYTARGGVECSYKLKTAENVLLASGSKYWNINVDENDNAEGRDDYIGAVDIDILENPFTTSSSHLVLELSVTTYCSLGNEGTIHIEGDYIGIRAKYK